MFSRRCRLSSFLGGRQFSSKKTIAVAMSGGIDSSAAALMLQAEGYNCVGVFMKNWDSSDEDGMETCPIDQDRLHMQEVCKVLGIQTVEVVSNDICGDLRISPSA